MLARSTGVSRTRDVARNRTGLCRSKGFCDGSCLYLGVGGEMVSASTVRARGSAAAGMPRVSAVDPVAEGAGGVAAASQSRELAASPLLGSGA